MNPILCNLCGTQFDPANTTCPACGAAAVLAPMATEQVTDPRETHIRLLLEKARSSAQAGDVARALCLAREALAQRNDCSTIHALLGQLYEQQGDGVAARYHFQAALNVTACETNETPLLPVPEPARQPQHAGMMMLVLIGCILISGLAALFTFHPSRDGTELGSIQFLPEKRQRTENPRWTWRVPPPAPVQTPAPASTGDAQESNATQQGTTATVSETTHETNTTASTTVLGPSAHSRGMATATGKPSLEAADQAFFRGEFDTAVALYEAALPTEDNPHPRVYRDLAWCYQQLGNSEKAAEYLTKAVQGYRDLLANDANNAAAQQGLETCTAALHTLIATRDRENPAP